MPWSMTNLPDVAKNKPEKQQEAFIAAANNALSRGLTEEEAIFAGIGAMRVVAKKNATVSKASYSAKEPLKRPSHIPDPVLIKAFQQQEAQEILEAEMNKIISVPSYLGKILPQGTQRNVIAANFDEKDRLVVLFDTGEKLLTDSINIKQYVDHYLTLAGIERIIPGFGLTVDTTTFGQKSPVISLTEEGNSYQQVFNGSPPILPAYPSIVFDKVMVDGEEVAILRFSDGIV